MEESVKDHAAFLTSTPWRAEYYKEVINAKSPESQAQALTGTYATDTRYKVKLMDLINKYNLKQYDNNQEVKTMTHKIYLDAGHGGTDPGATGHGLREKDLTLKIALYTRDYLNGNYSGHAVRMSRTTDTTSSLRWRTPDANAWGAKILVSIHINAFNGKAVGYEDFRFNRLSGGSNAGKLQNAIHAEVSKHFSFNRGKKSANFHMLRESRAAAVLTESGFIDNKRDADFLKLDRNLEKLGEAHAVGIAKYLGLKRKSGTSAPSKPASSTPWVRKSGQTGIFVAAHNIIRRDKKTVTANRTGIISAGDVIKYNGLFHADGYSWLEFKDGKGKYQYFPYRQHKPEEEWGKVMSQAEYDKNYASKPKVKKDKDSGPKGLFKVQTGAFAQKENAEALAKKMQKDGYDKHILKDK